VADYTGGDEDLGGGSSWAPESPNFESFGSYYGVCPVQPLGSGAHDSLTSYDRTLNSLLSSMALNARVNPPAVSNFLTGAAAFYASFET
jgi:hypothetical protein